ncbi:glycosyltransferase [Rhodoferax sp.]|uniref:glycosyltransferase n=1 Tax=Rhodoferax sp. TaxID=50421 RepID=UPI00260822E1|nr:glycosyltransferase [Rhodoferax sp.]MDD2923813.1 glycosyltransferase [Rhodoferax sp.]
MESFLSDLVQTQRTQGIDSHALVHGTPLGDDPHWLRRVPVQLQLIYAPIALGFRAALIHAIHDIRPDVLHLHMPNNSVFWALTIADAKNIPWVVHWHSDVVVSDERLLLRWAYTLYRPFEQAVLDHAERILVTSPPYLQASEPLRKWRSKCAVVPLGIDPASPHQTNPPAPWQPGRLRLLSIGRLAHYKGFETLVRAVNGSTHLQLIIAGQGESMAQLQAMTAESTPHGSPAQVQLLGEVSENDKHALLNSCDAFCLASIERTEAFGVVLLEAMAHARPCIVSDLPGSGMPWVVSSSGAGLSHLPRGDANAWRQILESLVSQPQKLKQWGIQGQQALLARFSISACARTIAAQYRMCQIEPAAPALTRSTAANPSILIVIPARDEAATIGQVVTTLVKAGWRHVFVIDDHSTDGTGDIAHRAGATVTRPVLPLGAWGGMQLGIRYARAHGFESVITMDADGQHEVEEIPRLLAGAASADVVIGAHPQRASRLRQIAWRWFRVIAGFELRDLTSGFRWYNQSAMEILAASEATLLDYQDVGVLLLLRKAGLRIMEVPVSMNTRQVGKSRIFYSWFSVLRYMVETSLLCLARWEVSARATVNK